MSFILLKINRIFASLYANKISKKPLPIAIITGCIFHDFFGQFAAILPYNLFLMLFISFSKVPARELRPKKVHFLLLTFVIVVSLLAYWAVSKFNTTLAERHHHQQYRRVNNYPAAVPPDTSARRTDFLGGRLDNIKKGVHAARIANGGVGIGKTFHSQVQRSVSQVQFGVVLPLGLFGGDSYGKYDELHHRQSPKLSHRHPDGSCEPCNLHCPLHRWQANRLTLRRPHQLRTGHRSKKHHLRHLGGADIPHPAVGSRLQFLHPLAESVQ